MQETSLQLKIGRSPWVLGYLLVLHGVMLWTLWLMEVGSFIIICASVLLLLSLWYQLGRYQWRRSRLSVVAVLQRAADHNTDEIWALRYADKGLQEPYRLLSSVVLAEAVIMRFQKDFPSRWWARYETVLVLAGSVEPHAFRQLRVRLRQTES